MLVERVPRNWDADVPFPALSSSFAEASRSLGFRPLYATEHGRRALVLVRSIPAPFLASLATRARVYASDADLGFLRHGRGDADRDPSHPHDSVYRVQEHVLTPLWDRRHPLDLRLFGGRRHARLNPDRSYRPERSVCNIPSVTLQARARRVIHSLASTGTSEFGTLGEQ